MMADLHFLLTGFLGAKVTEELLSGYKNNHYQPVPDDLLRQTQRMLAGV
jgi:hypothetical protein